ncbi:DUF31 family protein [Mycoplasmopsis cynos]|uniref:Ig-specific serine endopeptidase MIP n=1 Tax=Mycoplasmopsis cynos TaxID=171284 RepID=UPI002AFECA8E|nr:DUF31 family protein [Mycoplasmopsis cynos]WQQ16011.1 DUF31 family protein [Mycoplasmopsis cynos]
MKIKKIKNILLGISPIFPILLVTSCETSKDDKQNPQEKPPKDTEQSETPNDAAIVQIYNDAKQLTFNFTEYDHLHKKASDIFFTSLEAESIKFNVTGDKATLYEYRILSLAPDKDEKGQIISNRTGKGKISFEIKSKLNPEKSIIHTIEVSGFKNNPQNIGADGILPPSEFVLPKSYAAQYATDFNQIKRFEKDNEDYIKTLKRQPGLDDANFRSDLGSVTQEQKNKFNELAKSVNQDSYDNLKLKGFTLPVYDSNGSVKGLHLYDAPELGKGPSWVDVVNRNPYDSKGIPRVLINEHYRDIALQTIRIAFNNPDEEKTKELGKPTGRLTSGTAWILDYVKPESGKYPTKWYYGTNLHVADAFTTKTTDWGIEVLSKKINILTKLKVNQLDDRYIHKGFQGQKGIKKIFTGDNYLKTKPSDFLADEQKTKYANNEEFIDFAVLEIDFEDLGLSEAEIKEVTNDYANLDQSKKVKFISNSYLKDYSKIDFPLSRQKLDNEYKGDSLYILGYPTAAGDYFLKPYEEDDQKKVAKYTYSLWTNAETKFYGDILRDENTGKSKYTDKELKRGNFLSYEIGYRSFIDKPGVTDAFLASHRVGPKLHTSETAPNGLINFGLEYMPRHYVPAGGSSGSSVRNQNYELVGIFHAANSSANAGLAAAFRSEGYDYKGLYGSYNLPQYDLIYGGGKDQSKSYREEMKKLYESKNVKTELFPDGFEDDKVPEKFKFNSTTSSTSQEKTIEKGKS